MPVDGPRNRGYFPYWFIILSGNYEVDVVSLVIDEDRLSETFAALANPTRRAILARLAEGEATSTIWPSPST